MSSPGRPTWIAYLFAAPVVALMASSLINDPGRVGTRSSASGADIVGLAGVAYLLTALLVVTASFSPSRWRGVVLALQIVAVWTGGLLYAYEVRVETTWWDVAEDAFLLVTTLSQLVPSSRSAQDQGTRRDAR